MNKATITGIAAAAALTVVGAVRGFSPETDLSRSLGGAENRWAGVYAPWIDDGQGNRLTVEQMAHSVAEKDHAALTPESRAAADQHPMSAITGLFAALAGKADTSELADYAKTADMETAIEDATSSLVTRDDLEAAVEDALESAPGIDLTNYVTKDELDAAVSEAVEDVAIDPPDLSSKVKMYSGTITGDGSATEFSVTHNLGTDKVNVQAFDASGTLTGFGVQVVSTSAVKLITAEAVASGVVYTVVVLGIGA